ncbi:lipid A biosynthesis acyltransferase [Weeksella virosa]|uniref:Lipid A biosynthesis acyltransferase n=1 Tax=Weeksella virosa (strain ATCC 43766 / DSM 16922 / JCM 21250 / CCUG 30538 / CDC 9751 / IAM 14551 / NBRC 16016 / NCTC 11634 / CL345/78) TaxID=865938 RepID=F0NZ35_WEEVC|nr:lipid A biosynthesis acyltransferase [Weeksella virosa]ADX68252.1 lipid A biosynthesis acyltransferase [Weeksella virosa DSM 16922]SUP54565.1 lipid A biosynthesis lauroyl acyltransferase [Weeksella virosa]VEH64111.1 lipid A biosynthesis lauroyl acyltransferase [Weeksella virosa]
MTQWEGKSKGTLLGYKIFVYSIKKLGIRTAYIVLLFVAFYYFLFAWSSNRVMYNYFRKRQNFSISRSIVGIYKNYYIFGQTLLDKATISMGFRNWFTYDFDGIEILKSLIKEKKGGILISAHVGNFEIAEYFLNDINTDINIHLVTTDLERDAIKNYMEQIRVKSTIKFIVIQKDMSHIYQITDTLSRNDLICFTGDRFFEGNKTLEENLLGGLAQFPAGPFYIASRLHVPVAFVYVMKEPNLHYHLYTRKANFRHRDAQQLLKEYCASVEGILKKYPYQWFNYFDFWKSTR